MLKTSHYSLRLSFLATMVLLLGGCFTYRAELRRNNIDPLSGQFQLESPYGPQCSDHTWLTLRTYHLDNRDCFEPETLQILLKLIERDPKPELRATFAEVAYVAGTLQEKTNPAIAAEFYTASAAQAFYYLFETPDRKDTTTYDDRFQEIYAVYNGAVERLLRLLLDKHGQLNLPPGERMTVRTKDNSWSIRTELVNGQWKAEEIDFFHLASDYKIVGIEHEYSQGGIGIPLIAHRQKGAVTRIDESYYPSQLAFPMTAVLRPDWEKVNREHFYPDSTLSQLRQSEGNNHTLPLIPPVVLEFHDPLTGSVALVNGQKVPLQFDLTIPIAYYLTSSAGHILPWVGLFHPDKLLETKTGNDEAERHTRSLKGIYMLEPYQPGKIPVLFVHGLASSPSTWVNMFNTLRSNPEIRDNYQFWFYLYPSGQPFWVSADQLRDDLIEIRQTIDPAQNDSALDEMVLIGHSMGGLISRLQVLESENNFWNLVSDEPFDQAALPEDVKKEVGLWLFFNANQSIRRVVTIATPFEGSRAANDVTIWFAQKTINVPRDFATMVDSVLGKSEAVIKEGSFLEIKTSIASLSPHCPFFAAMNACHYPQNVVCNNIVGVLPHFAKETDETKFSDGVVRFGSAHRVDVESELQVLSPHMFVQSHPATINEIDRILKEHLYQMKLERQSKN